MLDPDIRVAPVTSVVANAVRLVADSQSDDLFYMTRAGTIYRVNIASGSSDALYSTADHGLGNDQVLGLAAGPDGALYVLGNMITDTTNALRVMRGMPTGSGNDRTWDVVVESDVFYRSMTAFDHMFNGMIVSPDGDYLYINSGSRTEHGEIQNQNGAIPDLREIPLTSAIFRVPLDGELHHLVNDEDSLVEKGYLFADGLRNSFDMTFVRDRLMATENSGDRDDGDEINVILEGYHYGFPWRMSNHDTPQRFPGYDPASDPLLSPTVSSYQDGFFYNDPTYPPPPDGVTFTDPFPNGGPDAARFRRESDGAPMDAATSNEPAYTLTPHRSPLGIVYADYDSLTWPYQDHVFVLNWSSPNSPLIAALGDTASDLLKISLVCIPEDCVYGCEQIATGFQHPIDAVIIKNKLYVLEMVFGGTGTLWELSLPVVSGSGTEAPGLTSSSLRISSIYPNPANDGIQVRISSERVRKSTISVFDVTGRRVLESEVIVTAGESTHTVDLAGLAPGVYTASIRSGLENSSHTFAISR